MNFTKKIGEIRVNLIAGDITKTRVDAFLVPEFDDNVSYGGVGGAVAKAGAIPGMEAYRDFVRANGKQRFGDVFLTESGGGSAKHLLHLVSVGAKADEEFETIQKVVIGALDLAANNGIRSVSAPALGTGLIGQMTEAQSALAMLSAIDAHTKFDMKVEVINIVIFNDTETFRAFEETLSSGSYLKATSGPGRQPLDLVQWLTAKRAEDETPAPRI